MKLLLAVFGYTLLKSANSGIFPFLNLFAFGCFWLYFDVVCGEACGDGALKKSA